MPQPKRNRPGIKSHFGSTASRYLLAVLVVAAVIVALWFTNNLPFTHRVDNKLSSPASAGTPVSPPAKKSTGPIPSKNSASTNNQSTSPEGGASDTQGSAQVTTNPSKWTTSKSGVITVKQPAPNSKLQNGSVLEGTAKVSEVQFRLTDNTIGVIAEGSLNVVNGKFSGTLHFSPHGTGGRLDVFSTDSRGVEYNEVQIYVDF